MAGWVLSPPAGFSQLVLSVHDGTNPVFPSPVPGAFNIEVFSFLGRTTGQILAVTSGFIVSLLNGTEILTPNSDPGFQASISDPFGNPFVIQDNFLLGSLLLGGGDYLIADYGAGGSVVRLGSGNQTVIGAQNDRLLGGLVGGTNQVMDALAGSQTVVGGIGNDRSGAVLTIRSWPAQGPINRSSLPARERRSWPGWAGTRRLPPPLPIRSRPSAAAPRTS
jgi:hypothetical protein